MSKPHSLTLIAVSPSSSTSALRHDLPSNNALRTASAVPPWFRLAVMSVPPVRNSPRNVLCSAGHRRAAVEERDVIARIERRQHCGEIAFVHRDAMVHRRRPRYSRAQAAHAPDRARSYRPSRPARRTQTTAPCSRAPCPIPKCAAHWPPPPTPPAAGRCHKDKRRSRAARDARSVAVRILANGSGAGPVIGSA